ncbi:MAG: hypothetical protein Q9196_007390, partial [Gyalolechia fulgens]
MPTQAEFDQIAARLAATELALTKSQLERDKAQRERDGAQRDRDEDHRLVQSTTLDELLETCHNELFSKLRVQNNPDIRTGGSYTSVKGKRCPHYLTPWTDFHAEQSRVYRQIYNAWNPPTGAIRDLPSLIGIQDKAKNLVGMVSSESDLGRFHYKVVEEYVEAILNVMVRNESLKHHYGALGSGFKFQNQPHALSSGQPEVDERRQQLAQDQVKAEPMEKVKEQAETS